MQRTPLTEITKYIRENPTGLQYTFAEPVSFTANMEAIPRRPIIRVTDPNALPGLLEKIDDINYLLPGDHAICASIIGGGRGGKNNSYSIGKIWEGTDVFIQLVFQPKVELKAENKETAVFRVSPNMMLCEINNKLYEENYHCPTLCGGLPYMSIAGGLSTGAHTSVGNLSNIVAGIELLLPNGKKEYFPKEHKDFDLVCKNASLGLLGVMTAVDIEVKPGRKKLERTITFSKYEKLFADIQADAKQYQLESRAIIFSPYGLNKDTQVKMTRWRWVAADTNDTNAITEPSVADSFSTWIAPIIATHAQGLFANTFTKKVMTHVPKTFVGKPSQMMAPEANLIGNLSEVGVYFVYDEQKFAVVLQRLQELFHNQEIQNKFPVNTAVYIRFMKVASGGHEVAMDFASLGANVPELLPFVNEFIHYLDSQGLHPQAHYGKSYGVALNHHASNPDLIDRCNAFYNTRDLQKKPLLKKLQALNEASVPVVDSTVDEEKIYQHYQQYCESNNIRMQQRLDSYLAKHYPATNCYFSSNAQTNKYAAFFALSANHFQPGRDFVLQRHEKELKKMRTDTKLSAMLQKYEIVTALQKTLNISPDRKTCLESFHQKIDQTREALSTNTNLHNVLVLKWFGIFAAAIPGLALFGIGAYYAGKAMHRYLNKTDTETTLIDKVEKDRGAYYSARPGR